MNYLTDWLTNHIMGIDRQLGAYINAEAEKKVCAHHPIHGTAASIHFN
jgi:hemerythrin